MKNVFLLLCAVLLLSVSCKKNEGCAYTDSTTSASAAERAYLQNYVTTNSLAAVEHASGVFYTVTNPGTGTNPSICSNITVKYAGTLIPTGTQFDASTSATGVNFALGQLIVGWQKVLPVLKSGGVITLYVPPSLGYGQQNVRDGAGNIVIPGNSYLKFTIELLNVQ
jgi:FKBP-type peptidyl-prolyl cis-trans isomerase FkpA